MSSPLQPSRQQRSWREEENSFTISNPLTDEDRKKLYIPHVRDENFGRSLCSFAEHGDWEGIKSFVKQGWYTGMVQCGRGTTRGGGGNKPYYHVVSKDDLEYTDEFGMTIAHYACEGRGGERGWGDRSGGGVEMLKLLSQWGADLNIRSSQGQTPLVRAAEVGNMEAVAVLIEAGVDLNIVCHHYGTALNACVGIGITLLKQRQIAQLLIDAGAILNSRDSNGFTPLMTAALMSNFDDMILLIRGGADATLETSCLSNDGNHVINTVTCLTVAAHHYGFVEAGGSYWCGRDDVADEIEEVLAVVELYGALARIRMAFPLSMAPPHIAVMIGTHVARLQKGDRAETMLAVHAVLKKGLGAKSEEDLRQRLCRNYFAHVW